LWPNYRFFKLFPACKFSFCEKITSDQKRWYFIYFPHIITETVKVICEICGQEIIFENYLSHFNSHEDNKRRESIRKIPGNELPKTAEELARASFRGKGIDKACQICLVEYDQGDKIIYLPCIHRFHEPCILDWLKKQPVCPVCQREVYSTEKSVIL